MGRTTRGLGKQSAIEALDRFLAADPQAEALLLFENSDVHERRAIVDQRVSLISTGEFLRELEFAGLIQSADRILDEASAKGRSVTRQRQPGDTLEARIRFREQLQRRP